MELWRPALEPVIGEPLSLHGIGERLLINHGGSTRSQDALGSIRALSTLSDLSDISDGPEEVVEATHSISDACDAREKAAKNPRVFTSSGFGELTYHVLNT